MSPPDASDTLLIRQAQTGPPPQQRAARAAMLTELQDVWYRFSLAQLKDPDAAKDATQETALRFLQRLGTFQHRSTLKTWSLGIALNVCREHRQKPNPLSISHHTPQAPTAPLAEPNANLIKREDAEKLRAAIANLPDRQREAVTLRFFESLSLKEIADVMSCAVGTVKATLSHALKNLRTATEQTEINTP